MKKIILFAIFVAICMFVIFHFSDHNLNRTVSACIAAKKQTSESFSFEKAKKFCKKEIKKRKNN